MHNTIKTFVAASALAAGSAFAGSPVAAPAPAAAPSAPFQGVLHVGYSNEYIWRGVELGDDLVEAGVEVSTEWNGLGLSAGAWYGSVHESRIGTTPSHYDELDLYAEASKDFGFVKGHLGYIWYHYDNLSVSGLKLIDDQQEIYFGVSRELAYGIEGSLTYYWDVETDNGGYTELGFSKSFEVCQRSNAELSWKTGYLAEEGELNHTALIATYNYKVTDNATLSPYIGVSIELDAAGQANPNKFRLPALTTGSSGPEGNQLFGGVKFAVKF